MTTLFISRSRKHYALASCDHCSPDSEAEIVRVDEPIAVDLELPILYARELLEALKREIAAGDFEEGQISVDLPVRLHLRPLQIEQLIEKLTEVTR